MNPQNPHLSLNQQGLAVALLHQQLSDIGHTIAPAEVQAQAFGPTTQQAVQTFQQQAGLPTTGVVDPKTAQAITTQYEMGQTLIRPPGQASAAPVQGNPAVSPLGAAPAAAAPVVVATADRGQMPTAGVPIPIAPGGASPGKEVPIPQPPPGVMPPPAGGSPPATGGEASSVKGQIILDHGLPATSGLVVRLYHRGFGADTLLGETKTDSQGGYALSYSAEGKAANLDVRVVGADGQEVPLSAPQYSAQKQVEMNLVAPASVQPLAAEYQRLSSDLSAQLGDVSKVGAAREDPERQDLTLLAQATGWDPRLLAIAATTSKLSATTGMPHETLYALARAGLPTDEEQLAWVDVATVQKALVQTNAAGISNFTDQQMAATGASFTTYARAKRLATKSPGTASSYGELASKAGLTGNEPAILADAFFAHYSTGADLWQQVQAGGIPQAKVETLRLQGKLAYLTSNNAELINALQQELAGDPQHLVAQDLYKPDGWKTRLNKLAGNDAQKVPSLIPPAYTADGATTPESLDAYAADLARRVRISYPTQVVERMLATSELQISLGKDNQRVQAFLQLAAPLGFVLGQTGIDDFVSAHQAQLFPNGPPEEIATTTQSVKTLHRLYQITPTNEALGVMLAHGFTSAHDVVAFSSEAFMSRYGVLFPSPDEGLLVFRKSQQVAAVTHSFLTAAQQMTSGVPVYALSASQEQRQAARDKLLKRYPTMEQLFGSLDFCECEHCRSVLSPAAYFVDLLQFLDLDHDSQLSQIVAPGISPWTTFLNGWQTTYHVPYPFTDMESWKAYVSDWRIDHPGAPDPFTNLAAWEAYLLNWRSSHPNAPDDPGPLTPYQVLTNRRPDLPYLKLTCENTNTAMPYIDLVNEILEYFIAHNNHLDKEVVQDTGSATTPELLAEPQNTLAAAYDLLQKATYPLTLPFNLWLETVRGFFDYYQLPFWEVLDVFRTSEELFTPPVDPTHYNRAAIFAEYLGIGPEEYALFTRAAPLADWFSLYGYQAENDALTALPSAKTLARTLGISYKDVIALVRTSFVNPHLPTLGLLYKGDVQADEVFRYEGQAGYPAFSPAEKMAFEQKLDAMTARFASTGFDARAWLDAAWKAGDFNALLVLFDTHPGGNFDETTLRFANGTAATGLEFVKIALFVRLWKRLGWSIEETDRALQVFLPQHVLPLTGASLSAALTTALLSIAHLKRLAEQCKPGQNGCLQLLTLWSDLETAGDHSLYTRLFLTKSILQNELTPDGTPVFDHPLGLYLTAFDLPSRQYKPFTWDGSTEDAKTGKVSLKLHGGAVKAALGLTMDEIGLILVDAGRAATPEQALDAEPLSLPTLSLLYRYGVLAQGLGLKVRDLIALKALSGLNPFAALSPDPLTHLADDIPLTQTLGFVEMVQAVQASNFEVEDLNYLLRHRFDAVGKYRATPNTNLALVKMLAAGIRGIESDNAVPGTTSSLTDDFLRQKLALALPADAVDIFFTMWNGTITYTAQQNNVPPASKLTPADIAGAPEIQIAYDAGALQAQRLTFQGFLLATRKSAIETAHPTLLADLLGQVEKQIKTYYASYLSSFLQESDFTTLFTPRMPGKSDADWQTEMQSRRLTFAQAFLPYLQQHLSRQLVVQTLTTTLGADPALTEDLLTDALLLSDPTNPPATGQPANSLLGAFTASAERGASVAYFDSGGGALPALSSLAASVDTTGQPANTNSARFAGYLEVPTNGPYRFTVTLEKPGATAEFVLSALPDPQRFPGATGTADGVLVELKAGIPYSFTLGVTGLGGGNAALLVQGENLPQGSLDRLKVYSQGAVERVTRAQTLLAKTLQLLDTFGFSAGETRYLLTHASDFGNLDLSALPTQPQDDTPGRATTLFGQFLRLAGYANLKTALAANSDDLLDLLAHASQSYPVTANPTQAGDILLTDVCTRLATLTRRDPETVQAVAAALNCTTIPQPAADHLQVSAPDFTQEQGLRRLWLALQTLETLGVSMVELARWLKPAPDVTVARDLRNTLKARFKPEEWQRIAQPIFDTLRQRQRDALVAYIMFTQGFELPEELFEFFLIDPGMEPVVQTSRLVLAISSVQVFIQRCLLNLEPMVRPQVIKSEQWQWMKRYRVWEANRKIFLFPENWLEPEFRDDKTNLFLDLESALLQGDISNDLAEDAFFAYLKGLEALALLDLVTFYCEEQSDPSDTVLHVVGRTHNSPPEYFYRTYERGMWTPWTPVTVDIDGNHVVAVIWRQRLHLFWATFMPKPQQPDTAGQKYNDMGGQPIGKPDSQQQVKISWTDYFQGAWTPPHASAFAYMPKSSRPVKAREHGGPVQYVGPQDTGAHIDGEFHPDDVFIYVQDNADSDEAITIYLSDPINQAFRLISKNSPPQQSYSVGGAPTQPYSYSGVQATRYKENNELYLRYVQKSSEGSGLYPILQKTPAYTLLVSSNPPLYSGDGTGDFGAFESPNLIAALTRPFFYQDARYAFFVEPTMTEQTIFEWEGWAIPKTALYEHLRTDSYWNELPLEAAVPTAVHPPQEVAIAPGALHQVVGRQDWVTNPQTVLSYGEHYVGQTGGLTLVAQPSDAAAGAAPGRAAFGAHLAPVMPGAAANLAAGNLLAASNGAVRIVTASGLTREGLIGR